MRCLHLPVALAVLMAFGCVKSKSRSVAEVRETRGGKLDRCVALRGNGTHIISHIMFLARISEEWGVIDGVAGGSSSTISAFLYESILLNPVFSEVPPADKPEAVALLLKSIPDYIKETAQSPEWSALQSVANISKKVQASGVMALPESEWMKAGSDLKTILGDEEVRDLVNRDMFAMLANAPSPSFSSYQVKVSEAKKAAASLTNFDASDADVFVRPGVLNFPHFIEIVGRVADFYAGEGAERGEFKKFISACAAGSRGKVWEEISRKESEGETCGARFANLVRSWRSSPEYKSGNRLSAAPGQGLATIMITSVLRDQAAIEKLHRYRDKYHKGQDRQIGISFDEVKFGYWISPGFPRQTLETWNRENPDGKSKKAISLGAAGSWREILEKSPREPSLGEYVPFEDSEPAAGAVSLGGWADLHPVQVLKAGGCAKVVYLTRRTGETSFITAGLPLGGRKPSGIAELLGLTEADYRGIYSLDDAGSAYSRALRQADGVWCTDWNKFSAGEQQQIAADTWKSPLLTRDPGLAKLPMADKSPIKITGCH